jgi:proteasome accessory factor B
VSSRKSERLLNLLILLLVQTHYISKDRIRRALYPQQGDEAFEKMFERDKDELRSLGVPLEVGQIDAFFDDEPGYRVRPDEFALPEIQLAADEASIIAVATKVWEHSHVATETANALRKLAAEGVSIDSSSLTIASPTIGVDEPSFDAFWDAVLERYPVSFYYRSPTKGKRHRTLEPYAVLRSAGRWYVYGRDKDTGNLRTFRLSRVLSTPHQEGGPAAFDLPSDLDLATVAQHLSKKQKSEAAVRVWARQGCAIPLRRRADQVLETVEPGWDELVVPDLTVDEVLGFGADLVIIEPRELRAEVIERLERACVERFG